jgi:hypothetical protein
MQLFGRTVRKFYNFEKSNFETVEFLLGRFKKPRRHLLIKAGFKTQLLDSKQSFYHDRIEY